MRLFYLLIPWLVRKLSCFQLSHQNPTMEILINVRECWKAVGQIYLHGTRLREREEVEQGEILPHCTLQGNRTEHGATQDPNSSLATKN